MSAPVNDRWVQLQCPKEGHRNFVLQEIAERYVDKDGKFVLVVHVTQKNDHFICGIFHDLKSCLLARAYGNFGITMTDQNIDGPVFFQAHKLDGTVVDAMKYDISTNAIREL